MPGTLPTEIYKLLFRHVSDIGHCITNLASCMITHPALSQVMCDASVLAIDNPGGKGVRVLCLLDAFGKAAEQVGIGLRDGETIDASIRIRKKENRDRRGPMVCMSAVTWRMRQMKSGFVIRLHDIVKAFDRVKHDCMEEWLLEFFGDDAQTRLQGIRTCDTAEPRIFRRVYDDAIQKWSERKDTRHVS